MSINQFLNATDPLNSKASSLTSIQYFIQVDNNQDALGYVAAQWVD